ncbi:hypothetical protein [Bacillus phage PK16]|nr:hypothetical protein [Bacillus phage PK16]AUM58988.1 hypothetical protein BCP01_187 [Bacillus phage BCP01]
MGEELAYEKIAEIVKKGEEISASYDWSESLALEALLDWIKEEYHV